MEDGEKHHRYKDGTPTGEAAHLGEAAKPWEEAYGRDAIAAVGPVALMTVRSKMIQLGWCRNTVNRIRQIVRWGVARELVQPATYQALQAVQALGAGRSDARETEPVPPVAEAVVDATVPHMSW